jgi:hypothetical protein
MLNFRLTRPRKKCIAARLNAFLSARISLSLEFRQIIYSGFCCSVRDSRVGGARLHDIGRSREGSRMDEINAGASDHQLVKEAPITPVNSIVATAATACDLDTAYKDAESERKEAAAKKNHVESDQDSQV